MRIFRRLLRIAYGIVCHLPAGRLTDRIVVSTKYRRRFGHFPNLRNPQRFSEKVQRRKLFDRNPGLTILQDKFKVRDYVARRIGTEYLVPLLQVTDDPGELDFDSFPEQFVLKANHGCGMNLIVHNKSTLDFENARGKAREWLKANHYRGTREWAYRDIPPLLMVEAFVEDHRGYSLPVDFKISCFDGVPRYLIVFGGRSTEGFDARRFVIRNGVPEPVDLVAIIGGNHRIQNVSREPGLKTVEMEKMIRLASELARGNDHLRVDFYHNQNQIYFGEMTLYFGSGMTRYDHDIFDFQLGSWWSQPY